MIPKDPLWSNSVTKDNSARTPCVRNQYSVKPLLELELLLKNEERTNEVYKKISWIYLKRKKSL